MSDYEENLIKPVVVFLSSSATNIAYDFAKNSPELEVFLIVDRKIPLDVEEEMLGNFYIHYFDKDRVYEKNKDQYFDMLAMQLLDFEPDLIICSNYYKLLPQSFIEFVNFRNSLTKILNIHHADLRVINTISSNMEYRGLQAWKKQFRNELQFLTTLHLIENEEMDTGRQLRFSEHTTFEELKELELIQSINEIESLRVCNVILHYHEQSKVLELLVKEVQKLIE